MSRTSRTKGESQVPRHVASAATPSAHSGIRLRVLLGALLLLAVVTAGVYIYRARMPALPEGPKVDLEGVDPEIANLVRLAQEDVAHNPRSADAWGQLAMVLHANGFDESAHVGYAAASRLDESNPKWPYLQGYLHFKGPGGPEAALPCLNRAAGAGSPGTLARVLLADTLLQLGRLDEAGVEYQKVLAADKSDPQALFGMGKLAAERKQYQEALEYLKRVETNLYVQNHACAMRVVVLERLGDHAAADRERMRLAELPEDIPRPEDPLIEVAQMEVGIRARLVNADKLWRQNRIADLIEGLEETVRKYPRSDTAWSSLGVALARTNKPEAAERAIQKSIELAPKNADHQYNLGMLLLSQHRYQEGVKTFERAIELKPTSGPSHLGLGDCLQALEDLPGAAEEYRASLRYQPNQNDARRRLEKLGELKKLD